MLKKIRLIYWQTQEKLAEIKYNRMKKVVHELEEIVASLFLEEMPDHVTEATEFINLLHQENTKFCEYNKKFCAHVDRYTYIVKKVTSLL